VERIQHLPCQAALAPPSSPETSSSSYMMTSYFEDHTKTTLSFSQTSSQATTSSIVEETSTRGVSQGPTAKTTLTSFSTSAQTASLAPSTTSTGSSATSEGYSISNGIALGVERSLGLPTLIATVWMCVAHPFDVSRDVNRAWGLYLLWSVVFELPHVSRIIQQIS